ncbi:MAG: Kelch repeat-containing protein [Candidatus Hermodarchaeota archaeon]
MQTRKLLPHFLWMVLILVVFCFGYSTNGLAPLVVKPSTRMGHQMVYDSSNQQIILFGGTKGQAHQLLDDTWAYEFTTNTWTALNPATKPSPRSQSSMVYDPVHQKVILFGGASTSGFKDDTWIFDYLSNQWTQVFPNIKPPARHSHPLIYDSTTQKLILFGGYGLDDVLLNDTWVYDYTNNTWTELTPTLSPIARYGHPMVYDPVIQKSILFGGNTWTAGNQNDTWIYDYSSNTWTKLAFSTHPSARKWSSMVYDPTNHQTILFGGASGAEGYLGDTWIYQSSINEWSQIPTSIAPSGRTLSALAYDSVNQQVILFGGREAIDTLDDTWAYDPASTIWTVMDPASSSSTTSTLSSSTSTVPANSTDFLNYEVFLLASGVLGIYFWYRRKTHLR